MCNFNCIIGHKKKITKTHISNILALRGCCTETMQSQHKQIKYPAVIIKHLR